MLDLQHPSAALARTIEAEEAPKKMYDAVIVGSGISGSILAHELASNGYDVLIVEAGFGRDLSQHGYEHYLEHFYSNPSKDNNAPFRRNPNAEMPRSPDLRRLAALETNTEAYWVQSGPFISDSVYARVLGGTTVHWEGKAIRMLREDFKLRTKYGRGLDWPLGLDDLMPYYEKAEFALGVSGDVKAQEKIGVEYSNNYVYPMVELKASYLDQIVARGLRGMQVNIDDEKFELELTTFPQAKNADPNPEYSKWNSAEPYKPIGAISLHQDQQGERCQGNTNCVPLCPVQARFDARKLLFKALNTGRAELLTQAVASRVLIDPDTGNLTEIEIKRYEDSKSDAYKSLRVRGKLFILAANAVENARLILSSAIQNKQRTNAFLGRHLMDHPYLLCWALLTENAGVGRGPSCTSGLCNFRRGDFRHKFAAFAADIHNDGWGWATGAPVSDLLDAVDKQNLYGRKLRENLMRISRQLLLAFMIEMPADPESRVTVDKQYVDRLGNMRPVVKFKLAEYSLAAAEFARHLSSQIFQRLGVEKDFTCYANTDPGYVTYKGEGYTLHGGNHLSGTHVMGSSASNSVVNADQKSWDHGNLYLVGPGSIPSIGSSNTTLTTAAICYRSSEAILKHLKSLQPKAVGTL